LIQAQVCAAATTVTVLLAQGERVHFVAVPFYNSLFVFADLKLRAAELVPVEVFVLA
jgi:hypothetical protein